MSTTPRLPLLAALVRCAKVAIRSSDYPELGCVLLSASDGILTLTACDRSLWLTVRVPTTSDLAPRLVNAKALLGVVRAVTGDVALTATGTDFKPSLTVEADGASFVLVALAKEHQSAPEATHASLSIPGPDLTRMLARTVYSIPPDDNRYGLNGLAVDLRGDVVRFVSTDGNRLSYAEGMTTGETTPIPRHLLPSKAARVLAVLGGGMDVGFRVLPDEPPKREGDKSYPGKGYFACVGATWTLTGSLIIADFPDYRQVIPSTYKRVVVTDRAALVKALRRMRVVTDKSRDGVTKWAMRSGGVDLSASYGDIGTARATVPAGVTGDDITVGMNARFVLDVLTALPDGPVELSFGDALSPVRIVSLVDGGSVHVVMPVRLG